MSVQSDLLDAAIVAILNGSTTDASGNENHVTPFGAWTVMDDETLGRPVFAFNGASWLGRDRDLVTPVTYPFTMACWVKRSAYTSREGIFGLYDAALGDHWFAISSQHPSNQYATQITYATALDYNGTVATSINVWYHYIAEWVSTTDRRFYVLGDLVATSTTEIDPGVCQRLSIGRNADISPGNYLTGCGTDYLLLNRQTTSEERAWLANPANLFVDETPVATAYDCPGEFGAGGIS